MERTTLWLLLCALCVLVLAPTAHAQEGAHATAAARSLFQEGLECVDHEDWTCAVDRFEQAYRLRPSPVIASNSAVALGHVGRWVEASERFRAVTRDPAAPAELRTDSEHRLAELTDHIGRLTIQIAGSSDGIQLAIDGHPLAISLIGIVAPADAGEHVVEARRGGEVIASAHAHIEAHASSVVELTIPAAPPATPSVAPVVTDEGGTLTLADRSAPIPPPQIYEEWWFWTLIGGVVLAAAIGITVGVLANPDTMLPSGSLGTIDGRM